MATTTQRTEFCVALIGNPNTGKSTLFNALAGVRQRVGNYPGVTVEKKSGVMRHDGCRYRLIDLPGTYSLTPRSPDEMITVDVLLGRRTDTLPVEGVVCIADASNLKRNLYLLSQVLELGLPALLVLNMVDVARRSGIDIDVASLEKNLGIPVVATTAHRGIGIGELKRALSRICTTRNEPPVSPLPKIVGDEVSRLDSLFNNGATNGDGSIPAHLLQRLLLDSNGYLEGTLLAGKPPALRNALTEVRRRLADAGHPVAEVETRARYQWSERVLEGPLVEPDQYRTSFGDRIDRVLTHRIWGMAFFIAAMVLVFESVFSWAIPFMDWIDAGVGGLGDWIETVMPSGVLRDLIVDGVIAGVGGVVIFLPQILILFLFIAVLEDCGYMARAAYLMDRTMSRVGLSGKSFIPLLSSFACAIPGIMAARVIENRRDRLTTILVAPLMTCSARLPVYALLIAAFIPSHRYLGGWVTLQGLTLTGLYLLGIVAAVLVALILKRTVLRGSAPVFIMELPSYKWPTPRTVIQRAVERAWRFVRDAGTIILAVSIIVWAALYFPRNTEVVEAPYRLQREKLESELALLPETGTRRTEVEAELGRIDREIAGAHQRQSFLGRAGRIVEPVFRPLGWDWRISCAVLASFPAREVVVATLGIIYDLGEEADAESEEGLTQFQARLEQATWDGTDRKVFTVPVAFSVMVFFALCAQCAATLAVIKRETNSWRWPLFTFAYMTSLAYVAALVTYQVGTLIAGTT